MFDSLRKIACGYLEQDGGSCHDWEHTERVIRNALFLASAEGADTAIVEAAAILHDIGRPREVASRGRVDHAAIGASLAMDILEKNKIGDSAFRIAVFHCIASHRYRNRSGEAPQSIEAKVLYDADKLDSLGAVGVARSMHFAGRVGARIHNTADEALNSPPYSREDSAYREYLVKLRYLPQAMLTAAGAEIAKQRLAFMESFFEELTRECFS